MTYPRGTPTWGRRWALATVALSLVGMLIVFVGWPASGQASASSQALAFPLS